MFEASTTVTPVTVDQCVFTSVRSPMGEGYRIIAKTPGIKPEEAAELPQRAPSHGGLCEKDEHATGMLAFQLASGRYAIGFSRHAGREHTARGGLRAHTHFVVIDETDYSAFNFDPWAVVAAIRTADDDKPLLKARPQFSKLELFPETTVDRHQVAENDPQALMHVVRVFLGTDAVVVDRNNYPHELAWLAWRLTPAFARKSLSVSDGVCFAPARSIQHPFIYGDTNAARNLIADRPEGWCVLADATEPEGYQPSAWIAYIEQSIADGNVESAIALCDEMVPDHTPKELDKVAEFFHLPDLAQSMDRSDLARVELSLHAFSPKTPTERRLVNDGRMAVQLRAEALNKAEAEAAAADTEDNADDESSGASSECCEAESASHEQVDAPHDESAQTADPYAPSSADPSVNFS